MASSEPQNSAESKTIEVMVEGDVVEESTSEPQKLNNEPRAVEESSSEPQNLIESKTIERSTSQPDKLAEPWAVEVVAKDYDVSPNDLAITIGRAYDSLKKDRGFQGNQYTVEVVSSQVDHSAEPKTVEVVANTSAPLVSSSKKYNIMICVYR